MEVRDAVEADAAALSTLADTPKDVMRGVVHDRTVRVLEPRDEGDAQHAPNEGASDAESHGATLAGFVAFDARSTTVYVTQLAGESIESCARLLEEPRRFAQCEDMAVEFVIEDSHECASEAARDAGFDAVGPGPRFEGQPTTRFRLENP